MSIVTTVNTATNMWRHTGEYILWIHSKCVTNVFPYVAKKEKLAFSCTIFP